MIKLTPILGQCVDKVRFVDAHKFAISARHTFKRDEAYTSVQWLVAVRDSDAGPANVPAGATGRPPAFLGPRVQC